MHVLQDNLYTMKDSHGFMINVGVFLVSVTSQRRDIICISLFPVEYVMLNMVTVLLKIAL